MKKNILFAIALFLLSLFTYAQQYITEEREIEIKTTDNYYWAEGLHPNNENEAKSIALNTLGDEILKDVLNQSIKNKEDLKELEMSVHFDRIQQEGEICILAWISKDNVFITTKRPVQQTPKLQVEQKPANKKPEVKEASSNTIADPVLQHIAQCKNYKEVSKVLKQNGYISGALNSTEGFDNKGQCIIAVFSSDGMLRALLDKGDSSRKDMITGEIIKNPETYYRNNNYSLLYFQQK
ncbi:MAG: hypothetical protein J6T81_00585 [Bacteroidales bacterium]|nr:hypothetical protein [Bacteroidales bacterium]